MFFQGVKISQRDSVTWSINFYCLAAMQLDRVETKGERFVSRYIANAIYCIIWKYRDIAIFRKYRDILTIFSVSDNGQF